MNPSTKDINSNFLGQLFSKDMELSQLFGKDSEEKAFFMIQFYSVRLREAVEGGDSARIMECLDDLSEWPVALLSRFPSDVVTIFEKLIQFEVKECCIKKAEDKECCKNNEVNETVLKIRELGSSHTKQINEYRLNQAEVDKLNEEKKEKEQNNQNMTSICQNCGKRESKIAEFSLCGNCKSVSYCSRECQKKKWPTHKLVCGKI
jgi:hypothetical protein